MSDHRQNRVQIPHDLIDQTTLEKGKPYSIFMGYTIPALFIDTGRECSYPKIAVRTIDSKGRIYLSASIYNTVLAERIDDLFCFLKDGKIYVTSIYVVKEKSGLLK